MNLPSSISHLPLRILLLNQTFYPDHVSTAQHLSDLALRLVDRGHQVTVLSSRRAYDDPEKRFTRRETWRGVRIIRIGSTGFGKSAKWRRAIDFASFNLFCSVRALLLPRHDVVVALTSPPLISVIGACLSKFWRARFYYWVMDLNPDEAIAAGWLREGSFAARLLARMSLFSFRGAHRIIALDRFMRDRIASKGIAPEKIEILAPWSHDDHVRFDPVGRDAFRKKHGLEDKFVIMYSGNHSPCHPLDTLLGAAERLAHDPRIVFCFVGGGSEFRRIQQMLEGHAAEAGNRTQENKSRKTNKGNEGLSRFTFHVSRPSNILCLPYQPLNELAGSLSAADLQVVVMGDPFIGIIHPCKIYNILNTGAPVLYIGPSPSHVSETLASMNGACCWATARHGEVEQAVLQIQAMLERRAATRRDAVSGEQLPFSKSAVLPRLIAELERPAHSTLDRRSPDSFPQTSS
ncbi:MAG: hypothetical protein C5B50_28190 [Verrucomicrobia bacterium]|nr:MAG: hypothetical protein C5B50_28190 [Verrucomicrobiota bacterium]